MGWLTNRLTKLVARRLAQLSDEDREFGEALLAEAEELPTDQQRWWWLLGGLRYASRRGTSALYWPGVVGCVAAVVVIDYGIGTDVASYYALAFLFLALVTLGGLQPHRAWISGLLLGASIAVANLVTLALGFHIPDTMNHMPARMVLPEFVLVLPSVLVALAAAGVARRVHRGRPDSGVHTVSGAS